MCREQFSGLITPEPGTRVQTRRHHSLAMLMVEQLGPKDADEVVKSFAPSFFRSELPHTAVLIDGSVSPERDEAVAW